MNLPNKLTILRILLIPIMMIAYSIDYLRINWILYPNLSIANFIVLLIFFIGSMTDFLDGHIARKYNLITNFGKFLDPLADKLLTCSAFIMLMQQNAQNQSLMIRFTDKPFAMASGTYELLTWWMVIIILAREFMVTGIRLLAAGQGKVIAASMYGKVKTTVQFITIIFLFAGGAVTISGSYLNDLVLWYVIIAKILIVATLAITIFSGYDYLVKNIDVLKDVKKKKVNK